MAIDWVNWLPAMDDTRVKRGTPFSTTAMFVIPEEMWITAIASPLSSSSVGSTLSTEPSSARTIANDVTSIWLRRRPAPSTAVTALAIMSRCAATRSTSIMCSSAGVM